MKITELKLAGVKILEPKVFADNRGHSFESCSRKVLQESGIAYDFKLDYEAYNIHKNTIRGIHFQNNPKPQPKLVRVLQGEIYDVVVDLRKDSPTYKQWIGNTLSAENKKQILIPSGFGHAFLTTAENTVVLYKFDDYYDGGLVRAIRWNDPEIGIDWGIMNPTVSETDANAPLLKDSDVNLSIERNRL